MKIRKNKGNEDLIYQQTINGRGKNALWIDIWDCHAVKECT